MSYRNPQIIQDRSGEIIPQALAQATGAIAQGVAKFGAEQKREREKRELERKQFNQSMIKLSNEQAADASLFNKGLEGMSNSMRQQMVLGNNAALERIYEIKKAQMRGNADPALSERLAQEQMKIATYNELAKAAIGATGDLPEMVRNYDQAGKTMFLTQDKNGSIAESDALFNGFGGAPGYQAGLKYKGDGTMVAWAKNKEGKYFEINAQNFPERMQNLTIQAKNPVNEMVDSQSSMLYDEKGNFLPNVVDGEAVLTRGDVNELGQSTSYERQALNTTQINKVREELFENNLAKINSAEGNRQLQDYYLDMFNIDVDATSWRNLSPEDKQKKVYASSDEIFFNSTKIEEVKKGEATAGYFRKLNEKTSSADSGAGGYKFASQFDEAIANKRFEELKTLASTSSIEDLLGLSPVMEGKNPSHVLQYEKLSPTVITLREFNTTDNNASEDTSRYDLTNRANVMSLLKKMGAISKDRLKELGEIADVVVAQYSKPIEGPVQLPFGPLNQ